MISLSQTANQQAGSQAGLIETVLEAIAMLAEGLGLDEVNDFLNEATGGALKSLEDAAGITELLRRLGLA